MYGDLEKIPNGELLLKILCDFVHNKRLWPQHTGKRFDFLGHYAAAKWTHIAHPLSTQLNTYIIIILSLYDV